jgi:shikimate dehydrogenase
MAADTERTYSLEDLEKEDFAGTPLAVLGHPVRHSISPAMHNAALAALAEKDERFADWAYYRFEVPPEELAAALPRFHRRSFLGLNLTIPHKVDALQLVEGVSPDAQAMGAVNTLLWNELGYDGFNTDGYGLRRALAEDLGLSLEDAAVVLLGSGGAARAAAVQCLLDGCARLCVGNRTPERLGGLMEVLRDLELGERAEAFPLAEPPADLPESGVLVNATSLGLKPSDPLPFDPAALGPGWKVFDMIYNPPQTPLLKRASDQGLPAANGLSMLVHQGARSLEIWSKQEVDAHAMSVAARHVLDLPPL